VTDRKMDVEHEDHQGLNCQRYNLRVATRTQNNHNRRKTHGTSQYKGVNWESRSGKGRVCITISNRTKHLGRFADELQAGLADDTGASEHFGEFALTNFPPKKPCQNSVLASMLGAVELPA
jgi:hypothetical protein